MGPRMEQAPVPTPRPRLIRIEPSPATLIALLSVLAALWLLDRLMPVLLVLLAALIIASALGPVVESVERRLHRGLAIVVVFSVVLAFTVLFITMTIPSLILEANALLRQEPALQAWMAAKLAVTPLTRPLADLLAGVHPGNLIREAADNAISFSIRIIAIYAYIVSSVFLSLYIMIDRDRLRGGLYLAVPRTLHVRLSRVMLNLETIVGGYLRGQAVTSFLMVAFVFILLKAFGVANALTIAVFAGAADVLPYSGAVLSVGAATVATYGRGPVSTISVLALMLAYEVFENRVIVPRVYRQVLRLPPSVIFFSLLAGTALAGVAGALFALPVAAALLMVLEELRVELPGHQELAADIETRERDDQGEKEYERRAEGMPAEQAAAIAVAISADRQIAERMS